MQIAASNKQQCTHRSLLISLATASSVNLQVDFWKSQCPT